jgi:hypothetical protein
MKDGQNTVEGLDGAASVAPNLNLHLVTSISQSGFSGDYKAEALVPIGTAGQNQNRIRDSVSGAVIGSS